MVHTAGIAIRAFGASGIHIIIVIITIIPATDRASVTVPISVHAWIPSDERKEVDKLDKAKPNETQAKPEDGTSFYEDSASPTTS